MNTIKLINQLSKLARLVEVWENPYHVTRYPFHYEDYTEEEFARLPEGDKYYGSAGGVEGSLFGVRRQKYVKDTPVDYTEMQNERGEVLTTESFKAEVRKVAGKIARDFDFLKHFYKIDTYDSCYLDLSFDDLFKTLLESASKQEKFFCLSAICHKMGVELEREGK